jgi:hypothetical protein
MADGQPEMIPMPGHPPQGGPVPELTRQLSPEEERSVLLNFMGNMYGEAKKMDSNIIGEATTLKRGTSEEIKKQIEQVYTQPQQSAPEPVQTAPSTESTLEEAQPMKLPISQPISNEIVETDTNQLTLNFNTTEKDELFLLVEKINTRLNDLNKKVDNLTKIIENTKVTSLPIKRQTKKKSVDK